MAVRGEDMAVVGLFDPAGDGVHTYACDRNENCTVRSPLTPCYIGCSCQGVTQPGVTIAGSINSHIGYQDGNYQYLTVEIFPANTTPAAMRLNPASRLWINDEVVLPGSSQVLNFNFTIEDEEFFSTPTNKKYYALRFSVAGHLKFVVSNFEFPVSGTVHTIETPILLLAGDLDESGTINNFDLILFLDSYGKAKSEPDYHPYANIYNDTRVGPGSLSVFSSNFGKSDLRVDTIN